MAGSSVSHRMRVGGIGEPVPLVEKAPDTTGECRLVTIDQVTSELIHGDHDNERGTRSVLCTGRGRPEAY